MNRQHRRKQYGEKMVVGTTSEIADATARGVVGGRIFVNEETETVMVQLPSGTLKVLRTTERPEQPDALSKPLISGPYRAPAGTAITLHASGSVQSFIEPNTDVQYYWYDGYTLVHQGNSFDIIPQLPIGSVITIGCLAIDDFNNTSLLTEYDVETGVLPVVRPFMNDLPEVLNYGDTGTFYIDPGTDQYGTSYTAIVSSNSLLTITGTTTFDLTTYMYYTATSDVSLYGDSNNLVELQLTGVTVVNEHVSAFIGVDNNQPPSLINITDTLPEIVYTDTVVEFTVGGAVDPEGQVVRYTVTSLDSDIALSGNVDLLEGDVITATINSDPTIAPKTVALSVTAKDTIGAVSAAVTIVTSVRTNEGLGFDPSQFTHDLVNEEVVGNDTYHTMGGMTVTVKGVTYVVQYRVITTNCTAPVIVPNTAGLWTWDAPGTATIIVTPYLGTAAGSDISISVAVVTGQLPPNLNNLTGIPTSVDTFNGLSPVINGAVDPEGGTVSMMWVSGDSACMPLTMVGGSPLYNGGTLRWNATSATTNCNTTATVIGTSSVSGLTATRIYNVTMQYNPTPPNLTNVTGIPSGLVINTSDCYTIAGATDPEGGNITMVLTTNDSNCVLPATAVFGNNSCVVLAAGANACGATITLIATSDVSNLSASKDYGIVVSTLQAPVLSNITGMPTAMDNNETVTPVISGITDPEGGVISFTVTTTGTCVTSPTATYAAGDAISLTSSVLGACTATMTISATSSVSSLTSTRDFDIVVSAADGIDLSNLSGYPTAIGTGATYNGVISGGVDPEGGTISYAATVSNAACLNITPSFADGGAVALVAGGGACSGGTVSVTVVGTSSVTALQSQRTYNILIEAGGVLNAGTMVVTTASQTSGLVSEPFRVHGVKDAQGGDNVTYNVVSVQPAQFNFNKTVGLVNNEQTSYTPTSATSGTVNVGVIAYDVYGNYSATKNTPIMVNQLPTTAGLSITLPNPVVIGTTYSWIIQGGYDANGDVLDHTATMSPSANITATLARQSSGSSRTFTASGSARSVNVIVEVFDNNGSGGTASFPRTLVSANQPPDVSGMNITGPSDLQTNASGAFNFTTASDPDGDTLAYLAVEYGAMGNSTKTVSPGNSFTFTAGSSPGSGGVTITATDPSGTSGQKSHNVTVSENNPPSLNGTTLTADWTLCDNGTIRLNGATDPDGDDMTWKITSLTAPRPFSIITGATEKSTTATHGYAPYGDCSKFYSGIEHSVRVVLTDTHGATATKDYTYTPETNPPVVLNCNTAITPSHFMWTNETRSIQGLYPCSPHTDADIRYNLSTGFTSSAVTTKTAGEPISVTAVGYDTTARLITRAIIGGHRSNDVTHDIPVVDGSELWNRGSVGVSSDLTPDSGYRTYLFKLYNAGNAIVGWTADIKGSPYGTSHVMLDVGKHIKNTIPEVTNQIVCPPVLISPAAWGTPSFVAAGQFVCHVNPWCENATLSYWLVSMNTAPNNAGAHVFSKQVNGNNFNQMNVTNAWFKVVHYVPSGQKIYITFSYKYESQELIILDEFSVTVSAISGITIPRVGENHVTQNLDGELAKHHIVAETKHDYYTGSTHLTQTIYLNALRSMIRTNLSIAGNNLTYDGSNYVCTIELPTNGSTVDLLTRYTQYGGNQHIRDIRSRYLMSVAYAYTSSLLTVSGTGAFHSVTSVYDAYEYIHDLNFNSSLSATKVRWTTSQTAGFTHNAYMLITDSTALRTFPVLVTFLAV